MTTDERQAGEDNGEFPDQHALAVVEGGLHGRAEHGAGFDDEGAQGDGQHDERDHAAHKEADEVG